jgi:hypothetical protein
MSGFGAYRLIKIIKVDPEKPTLKREVWEVHVHWHRLVLRSYRIEQRKSSRHKWRAEQFWDTYNPRQSTIKAPEFPVSVAERTLVEFVKEFAEAPKEMQVRHNGWIENVIGTVVFPTTIEH